MSRGMKTGLQIAGIILIVLICALIMYFGLAEPIGKGYLQGVKMGLADWLKGYKSILFAVAGYALFTSLLWYILARYAFKITSATGVGKRAVWGMLFILNIVGVVLITMFIGKIPIGMALYLVHILLFSVISYYASSLFCSPTPYKYTPIGAGLLAKKQR